MSAYVCLPHLSIPNRQVSEVRFTAGIRDILQNYKGKEQEKTMNANDSFD